MATIRRNRYVIEIMFPDTGDIDSFNFLAESQPTIPEIERRVNAHLHDPSTTVSVSLFTARAFNKLEDDDYQPEDGSTNDPINQALVYGHYFKTTPNKKIKP